jgi:hypothetical protein
MKRAVSLFVATLTSVASGAGSSEPKSVTLGESFELEVGESARIETEALEIGFEDVSGDSRCPKGEQCVWEGDATVRVWLKKGSETKETLELHTATQKQSEQAEQSEPNHLSYAVKLQRLDPYPTSGKPIQKGDYRATFEVTRGSSSSGPRDR